MVCEKPLCMNLAEADRMIEACRKANVHLMYAEELCFTPKYVRMKQLLDEGALHPADGGTLVEITAKGRQITVVFNDGNPRHLAKYLRQTSAPPPSTLARS